MPQPWGLTLWCAFCLQYYEDEADKYKLNVEKVSFQYLTHVGSNSFLHDHVCLFYTSLAMISHTWVSIIGVCWVAILIEFDGFSSMAVQVISSFKIVWRQARMTYSTNTISTIHMLNLNWSFLVFCQIHDMANCVTLCNHAVYLLFFASSYSLPLFTFPTSTVKDRLFA